MSNRSIETSVGREIPGTGRVKVELVFELGASPEELTKLALDTTLHALLGVGLMPQVPADDEVVESGGAADGSDCCEGVAGCACDL